MKKRIVFPLCSLMFFTLFLCDGRTPSIAGAVNYIYDKAGRLTKAKYDNGTTIVYTYDNAGNLLEKKISDSAAACTVASLETSSSNITLGKNEGEKITITVTGKNNCIAEGEIVSASVKKRDKDIISVSPSEQFTDADGSAVFTITAGNKPGAVNVKFTCNGKKLRVKAKAIK